MIEKYAPGIHKVDKKNSEIKYIDIFSKAYTTYETDKPYEPNGRVIDDKCYYDPITTIYKIISLRDRSYLTLRWKITFFTFPHTTIQK